MNDATYQLVKRHIVRISSGREDPVFLITDEKLPEDFILMHGREVHMGTCDIQDFHRRNYEEMLNAGLSGPAAT